VGARVRGIKAVAFDVIGTLAQIKEKQPPSVACLQLLQAKG
jgi:hypothetical protein